MLSLGILWFICGILFSVFVLVAYAIIDYHKNYTDDIYKEADTVIPDHDSYDLKMFSIQNNANWFVVLHDGNRIQSYEKSVYDMQIDGINHTVHFYLK